MEAGERGSEAEEAAARVSGTGHAACAIHGWWWLYIQSAAVSTFNAAAMMWLSVHKNQSPRASAGGRVRASAGGRGAAGCAMQGTVSPAGMAGGKRGAPHTWVDGSGGLRGARSCIPVRLVRLAKTPKTPKPSRGGGLRQQAGQLRQQATIPMVCLEGGRRVPRPGPKVKTGGSEKGSDRRNPARALSRAPVEAPPHRT